MVEYLDSWSAAARHCSKVLHSSDESGKLLQRQCHDDSTVNVVVAITVAIIIHATKL